MYQTAKHAESDLNFSPKAESDESIIESRAH